MLTANFIIGTGRYVYVRTKRLHIGALVIFNFPSEKGLLTYLGVTLMNTNKDHTRDVKTII